MSCQCKGIEDEFNERLARRELRSYRKRGPRRTTRSLIDAVMAAASSPASLLDIGGGVGAIQHELATAGVARIANVDASTAYLRVAEEEGAQQATAVERTYLLGDFVALSDDVADADIVTLDRVLCCYDDVDALVRKSSSKATMVYGLVYPRSQWWSRLIFRGINAMMVVRRSCFRGFIHDPSRVEHIVLESGFERFSLQKGFIWQIVVYRRAA